MKQICGFLFVLLSLCSCNERVADLDQLQLRSDGFYEINATEPYSGKASSFYENGQLKEEASFVKGHYDGVRKRYYESGQIREESHSANQVFDGDFKQYYSNGQIKTDCFYKNGELNGSRKTYSEGGLLLGNLNYIDGKIEGEYKTFYESGEPEVETFYKNGKIEGSYKDFYPEGGLNVESFYKDGKLEGVATRYYMGTSHNGIRKEGSPKEKTTYVNGVKNGAYKSYERNGHLKNEGFYKDDKLDGRYLIYTAGVVVNDCTYKNGECVERKIYSLDGSLVGVSDN